MDHYFSDNPSIASKTRYITYEINGQKYQLLSDNGVFSKNEIDMGTFILLRTIVPMQLKGSILDVGCGIGTIGLTIASCSPITHCTLVDVNLRALTLCEKNAKTLKLDDRVTILSSDVYKNVKGTFDYILSNPPIRAGKKVTYAIYEGAYERLNENGALIIVIRKAQGAESATKYIESIFGNVSLIERSKGYHVLLARKCK